MNMLVGPSLMRDQFKTPYDEECSLQSFTEASFESSGIPLHLNSGSAVGNASQVNKEVRNADESALESKQKTATQGTGFVDSCHFHGEPFHVVELV